MPGVFQLSPDRAVREAAKAAAQGVSGILLFGIPEKKDIRASEAYAANGIVQQAVRLLKRELPELIVIMPVISSCRIDGSSVPAFAVSQPSSIND